MKKIYDFDKAVFYAKTKEESNTIGVLAEKTLHSVLKYMLCEDETCHEKKYRGFVADVLTEEDGKPLIYEIQTRQVYKLRRKLEAYGDTKSVIVLPAVKEKTIVRRNKSDEVLSKPHKSPKHQTVYSKLSELYNIREYLGRDNVSFLVPVLKVTEYTLSEEKGKRKVTAKLDTVPEALFDVFLFENTDDFYYVLPYSEGETFTAKDLSLMLKLSVADARNLILVYKQLGIVEESGKNERRKVWKVIYSQNNR